jgi:TP901 family phage tail tape measure protein
MADAHQTTLGFEASQAISTLAKLEQATVSYAAGVDIATGSILNYNRAAKQTDASLKKNADNMSLVTKSMLEFGKTATRLPPEHPVSQQLRKLDEEAKRSSQSLTLTWKSMARIFTIQALHGAISKLTTLLGDAVGEARAFGIAIAEVQTIAGSLGLTFEDLAEQARGVAEAIGAPLDVVAEAQYQLYSNQVGGAVESSLALEAASKLSLAAVTSLNDAVGVVTGTLNSYGFSAARAEEVSAKLFRTVELGRVRAAELANTLGRTTIIAAQLGVSYEEVLASLSTMTIQGQKASDAQTRLTQVMLKLIRPTDAMKDAFAELGVVSAEAGIQAFGFQGFLEKLRGTTNGSVTEFAELFGRVRATAGALGITGKAAEKYRENLEKINATTTELLEQKVEIILETNAKQVEKELNALQILVVEEFGRGVNELLGDMFRFFGGAVNMMKAMSLAAGAAATAFLLMRAGAVKAFVSIVTGATSATAATTGLLTTLRALALSPAGVAVAVGAATALIIGYFSQTQDEANKTLDLLDDFRDKELAAQLRAQDKAFKARQKNNNKIISETQKWLADIVKLETDARERAADLEERATESLNNQLQNRAGALRSYVSGVIDLADTLEARLKALDDSAAEVTKDIEAFKFDRQIRELNDVQKIYALINKSQELRRQSTAASNQGEREIAESLTEQSKDYADQALQIADTTKNRTLTRKAEQEVLLTMGNQKSLLFGIAKQEEERKRIAEGQIPTLLSQVNHLNQLVQKLADTEVEIKKGRKSQEEIDALYVRRLAIAKEIEQVQADIAKGADVAAQLGLTEQLDEALKAVREGITGQVMDLSEIITFEADVITNALNVELDKIDAARLTRLEIIFDVQGAEDVAEALSQQPAILEAANERLERNRVLAHEIRGTYVDTLKDMAQLKAELESVFGVSQRVALTLGNLADSPQTQELAEQYAKMGEIFAKINTLAVQTAEQVSKLPTVAGGLALPQAQQGVERLDQYAQVLRELGHPEAAQAVSNTALRLSEAIQKYQQIQISTEGIEAQQRMQDVGAAAQGSATQVESAATSINNSLSSIEQQARRTASTLASLQLPVGGAVPAAHGALFLANGGFTPRGSDRIAAMLSRGESVINADSTRRFASQIQAMNAGITPVYRDAGGTVTVGDVNISVQGAPTPQQTAREVMSAFRREMRRKTSTF